ncbi:MAG: hypothetical protein J6S61_03435, partial [Elusimicrobiaceae bacterium]|nr:hypothetical protein [Elusimicrobiaceae bacterium]
MENVYLIAAGCTSGHFYPGIALGNALLEKGEYEKAGEYLSIVEQKSGYFDSLGNIEKGREGFYYYKGRYFMAIGQPDSAEYYFRKELQTGLDYTNQSMASRGISLVLSENGPLDSAIKYALFSYEMNDSVYAQMSTKEVERAKASYDYSRNQLLAEKEARRAEREGKKAERILYITLFIVFIGSYLIYYLFKQKRI